MGGLIATHSLCRNDLSQDPGPPDYHECARQSVIVEETTVCIVRSVFANERQNLKTYVELR